MQSELIVEIFDSDIKVDKRLKQLCRKTTGEQLKIYPDDKVITCRYNNKIIGMCCIAMKSPEGHFENEDEYEVPYLYNYLCDLTQKKKKPSVALMNYIKTYLKNNYYNPDINCDLNPNQKMEINLDIDEDNAHAMQFFEKNGFNYVDNYVNNHIMKIYKSYVCSLEELN
jgi:hypothetical protein